MSGRLKLTDELDLPDAELKVIRRLRGLRREKRRQFEQESPYREYRPPEVWGLRLREIQTFAALAATGGITLVDLGRVLYGERTRPISIGSIRSVVHSLRRSLFPLEVEIRMARGRVWFVDLPRVFALAGITAPLPSSDVSNGLDSDDEPEPEPGGKIGAVPAEAGDQGEVTYTVKEFLEKLVMSRSVFYERVNEGRITTHKMGRRTVILKRDLLAYVESERRAKFG